MDVKCPLPDFASALASASANSMAPYYHPVPSPADSGVMSPMTPMSNYTQGSTPEQHYHVASPEHLYGLHPSDPDNNIRMSGEYYHVMPSSPYPASVHSDEGVVIPKCHPYDSYDPYYVSKQRINVNKFSEGNSYMGMKIMDFFIQFKTLEYFNFKNFIPL